MSDRTDRLEQSGVQTAIDDLRSAVDEITSDARDTLEAEQPPGILERVVEVLDWLEGLIGTIDGRLVPQAPLDAAMNALAQAVQFVESPPSATNLDAQLDAAVVAMAPLIGLAGPLPKLLGKNGKVVGAEFKRRAKEIAEDLTEIQAELEQVRTDTDAAREAATADDEARVQAETARIEQLQASIDTQEAQIAQLVTTFQQQHDDAQAERATAFQTLTTDLTTKAEEYATELKGDVDTTLAGIKETAEKAQTSFSQESTARIEEVQAQGDAVLTHLNGVKKNVDELYEVIAKKGTAGAFHDEAETQETAANNWRKIALATGLIAVVVAGIAAFVKAPDAWEQVVTRAVFPIAIGAVSAYAAQQSRRHREREENSKFLELDLLAIEPFLQSIEDQAMRSQARNAFIVRWMATRSTAGETKDSDIAPVAQLVELLRQALPGGKQDDPPPPPTQN